MTGTEGKIASYTEFKGLRTDCPASKVGADYSPDCADMVFTVGGTATRNPFRVVDTLPAAVVYRKEFVGRDGVTHVLFLCVDGSLFSQSGGGYVLIDSIAPSSQCNSVTAYGREYMAFFNANGGSDAPRCWDGRNLYRVSQGGPGAAPMVTCITLPATSLIEGTTGTTVAIATVTPSNPQQVQVGGDDGGDAYDAPDYQTFYTALTVVTTPVHGLSIGDVISITGNSYWDLTVAYVSAVDDPHTFEVSYSTQDATVGTGGTVGISAPLLARQNNEVQAATSTPHGLRVGYQAAISGVTDLSYAITTLTANAASFPGELEIAFGSNIGFVPGDSISIANVPFVNAGGGVQGYNIANGIASVTTNMPHGLSVGLPVIVSLHTYAPRSVTVDSVLSTTVWTYVTDEPNVTDTGGYVHVPFPGAAGDVYTISEVPTPTTVRIAFLVSDYQWTGGDVTFPWNGTFYVDSVPSATTFTYHQSGPDATLQTGTGTVTPQGQISPGEHQCVVHYITETGATTAPSVPVRFTAKVNQYPLVTLPIGPANIKARIVSFTGVDGGDFGQLVIPARVGGIQVSTSTLVQDNTTTSAVFDFSDTTILAATRIDIPGNDLFEVFPLATPDGVDWYADRLSWKGQGNVMLGMQNMGMDGGTWTGSAAPLGWNVIGSGGSIVQSGFMPVYQIAAGQTGEIQQSCVRNHDSAQIINENQPYTLRLWVDGAHSGVVTGKIESASTSFVATANVSLSGRGYLQANFNMNTPAVIPDDMILSLSSTSGDQIQFRDVQMIYTDNPHQWPDSLMSYVRSPDTYDGITGYIGPNDDSTELRAQFRLQENFYFITARSVYYVQQIGNAEPSSWQPQGLSDDCGAFNGNAVTTGKSWAAWAGPSGAFWFSGGSPTRASAVIDPTWANVLTVNTVANDAIAKRVYFNVVTGTGNSILVYDYHEMELGGSGKWCPWNRAIAWTALSAQYGTLFCSGVNTFRLDTAVGVADDTFGNIGGYYTLASAASGSLFQKTFGYLAIRMSGEGTMTPFLSGVKPSAVTATLKSQVMDGLTDPVVEYPVNLRARLAYVKIGQPGLQFALEEAAISWEPDSNSPLSGTRR